MTYPDKLKIYERAVKIVNSSLDWKLKYDMIFCDEISMNFELDYYDRRHMDYEDDITAFMRALGEHMKVLKIINDEIDS